MPPRRGRGRGRGGYTPKKETPAAAAAAEAQEDAEMKEETPDASVNGAGPGEPMETTAAPEKTETKPENGSSDAEKPSPDDEGFPYQIKVNHMPDIYNNGDFTKYIATTFKVVVPKIVSPSVNSPWVMLCFNDQKAMEGLVSVLHNHVWRKRTLRAVPWLPLENRKRKREDGDEDQEEKKIKPEDDQEVVLTMEEEILSESLPLLNVSYEDQKPKRAKDRLLKPWMTPEVKKEIEKCRKLAQALRNFSNSGVQNEELLKIFKAQRNAASKMKRNLKNIWELESEWFVDLARFDDDENRLSRQDAELMSQRWHGLFCQRNKELAGWAEKSCDDNGGSLFKIEPLKVCTAIHGYRNKCKFRIGKNTDGETTVGFCLNDNENKILGVEPGDRFIHLPDSMKHAAKRFQDFIRTTGKEPYDKKKKAGTWDNLLIRVSPDGALMLIAIVSPISLNDAELAKVKDDMKTFFTTGEGSDCNVFSLYLQVLQDHAPIHPVEKLELLTGKPDYEENICGLKFYVSPFSILNINPSSSENIYSSVIELAEPTPESVVIDVCAGSCGIAFTFASKVEKAYAIEPQEENVRDALKTKALNNITNVEIIKGKCEDHLEELFEKLKEKPLIVVLDPPRHGVVSKIISQIRAQPNVQKVIYVCSNTKTGVKNFLDFCAKEGKDHTNGVVMSGLPFLPVRGIPIDVAPYTVNNTVPVLLERIDPSTYPAATKPPPEPVVREVQKKKNGQVKRRPPNGGRGGLRGVRGGGVRGMRGGRGGGGRGGPYGRFQPAPPFMRPPMRPLMGGRGGRMGPNNRYMETNHLISKYERRIAELEQQDRAFKAGLSMGLQAATRGGPGGQNMPRNMGDYSTGEAFGGYRGGYKDPYGENSGSWQQPPPPPMPNRNSGGSNSSFGGQGGFGSHATGGYGGNNSGYGGNNSAFGGRSSGGYGGEGGYGSHAAYGTGANNRSRPAPLAGSRFVGVGESNRGRQNRGGRGGGNRGRGGPRQ